jgi:hypothetical protein
VQAYGVVETYDVLVDVAHATGASARCRRRSRKSPTTLQACTLDASNDYDTKRCKPGAARWVRCFAC